MNPTMQGNAVHTLNWSLLGILNEPSLCVPWASCVGDSDIRLTVRNVFGVAVQGFSTSTTVVSTDSLRVCANPLVPW
jgi:hypothetical protein